MICGLQKMTLLDYPGKVACTVFLAGCNYRCPFCHNAELLDGNTEPLMSQEEFLSFLSKRKGLLDGVVLSGGEPLMQAAFAAELFRQSREAGLNTCLDTSGCVLNAEVEALLAVTDRVLLDLKYVTEEKYRAHVGCGLAAPLKFLARLNELGKPVLPYQEAENYADACNEFYDKF